MNNKIKLAVAGAVLSAASVANAGIVIPAGDWTLDVNGNVNAFATWSDADKGKVLHLQVLLQLMKTLQVTVTQLVSTQVFYQHG